MNFLKVIWVYTGTIISVIGLYMVFGKDTLTLLDVLNDYHDKELEKMKAKN